MPILYLLSGEAELADTVGGQLVYGKSLLYLVSNACEEKRGTPILGMLRFLEENKGMYAAYQAADARGLPQLIITGAQQEEPEHARTSSRSSSHGGFDNDVATMNSVLYRILGNAPLRPFNARDLAYG